MNEWIVIEFSNGSTTPDANKVLGYFATEKDARKVAHNYAEAAKGSYKQYRVAKLRYNYVPPKTTVVEEVYPS